MKLKQYIFHIILNNYVKFLKIQIISFVEGCQEKKKSGVSPLDFENI